MDPQNNDASSNFNSRWRNIPDTSWPLITKLK